MRPACPRRCVAIVIYSHTLIYLQCTFLSCLFSPLPKQLAGFDQNEPTAKNMGKAEAIALIRQNNPYSVVAMVGDGITDLEAVQVSGGADLFIG